MYLCLFINRRYSNDVICLPVLVTKSILLHCFSSSLAQHTSVECSWDAGEKRRERVLTNLSQWRQLNESDLQQYIASSDSSDEEGEDNVVPGQCKRQGSVGLDESSETHTNRK